MDDEDAYAKFALNYRILRAWAGDSEVRRAYQAHRRTTAGQAEALANAMAEVARILRKRASEDLGHLARACATAAEFLEDLANPDTAAPIVAPEPYWVFTFGGGQRLRSTPSDWRGRGHRPPMGWEGLGADAFPMGLPLRGRFVRIPATSEIHARAIMFALFGHYWASQYPDEAAAEVDRHHLTELDVTEALAELAKMPDLAVPERELLRRDNP